MSGEPTINSLLEIMTRDGYAYRSRVEDLAGRNLTLAAPIGVRDREPPAPGDQLKLAWVVDGSRMIMSAVLAWLTRDPPPCWHVEMVGAPQRDSRRRHVRGGGGESIRLARTVDGEPEPHLVGRVADLSESSLRCRLPAKEYEAREYAAGDAVEVRMVLGNDPLEAVGQVLAIRRTPSLPDVDVVLAYELSETAAQMVRRYLFQRQLAERRSRRNADY